MTAAAPRLLLVDDDEAACTLLAEVLERESYSVVRALSGKEALERVDRDGPFDAVLTDLRMPGSSGLDLLAGPARARRQCHRLRADRLRRCRRCRGGDPGRCP